jgi:DNA repair protein RadC
MIFENFVIERALAILTRRLKAGTVSVANPDLAEEYLLHKLILEEREIFGALWLDVKNRLIGIEDIALGSINTVNVYPREVVKSAMRHNAANVIFYHNHPSGEPVPSEADKVMTANMKKLLRLVDVRLLDHIIISGTKTRSLAKRGEL